MKGRDGRRDEIHTLHLDQVGVRDEGGLQATIFKIYYFGDLTPSHPPSTCDHACGSYVGHTFWPAPSHSPCTCDACLLRCRFLPAPLLLALLQECLLVEL